MTTAAAVGIMKAAQVTAAGAGLKIVELVIPDPGPGQVRIKVAHVACATAMRSSPKASGQESSIHAFRVMKWPAWWMSSGQE